jgi:hypothetical protein
VAFSHNLQQPLLRRAKRLIVIVTISTPLAERPAIDNCFMFVCFCGHALRARRGLSVWAKPDSNVKHLQLPIEALLLRATGIRGARAPVGRVAPCVYISTKVSLSNSQPLLSEKAPPIVVSYRKGTVACNK